MNIINQIENIINTAAKFKNAYFFTPPGNASSRRNYEKYNSVPCFTFDYDGHTYTAEYKVSCSCKNVYAQGVYTKDGKKTTLTAIKNVYKKMKAI